MSDAKLDAVAAENGVTDELRSCHTAKVDGYTVEGHVPAADVRKMLKERPMITGIAVPGMPNGIGQETSRWQRSKKNRRS